MVANAPVRRSFLMNLWERSVELNFGNIVRLAHVELTGTPGPIMCDLGCGDGILTERLASHLQASRVEVVETYGPHVELAQGRGFHVHGDDLNGPLSFPDGSFDLVVSNQVIEHLYDTDLFLAESVRMLKPGGTLIVSTENPASWHNIGALVIGWQQFSLSNVTSKAAAVGNPLSLAPAGQGRDFPMQHHRLFTPKALCELLSLHGLERTRCVGAGYHPLPPELGRLDPTHAHFITAVGRKRAS
jgi:2-polyprenyl-3-methyl-5-hydroxy-6-metoxy-1,4-benzoquinol methylase